jgi:nitrogen fixation/metabolism regulation signal transduction histidine kinase
MQIRHIATRFALLLGVAAVLPLVAYGIVSILSLQRGTRESVVNGNQNVAVRAAEEIRRYVVSNAELLKALAADLQDTGLDQHQQDQILKNYVLQFREFHEISLFDEGGAMVASSRVGKPRVVIPKDARLTINCVSMSPIRVDEDLLPTSVFSIRLTHLNQPAGWLAGEFSLEEMWRMVDQFLIGAHGFAIVLAP